MVEFLRAKDDRFFGPLTAAQVIALALAALAPCGCRCGRTWAGEAGHLREGGCRRALRESASDPDQALSVPCSSGSTSIRASFASSSFDPLQ